MSSYQKWKLIIFVIAGFNPTFKIQGQVYHLIGSLLPVEEEEPKFLQIYFIGNEDSEADRRCEVTRQVERNIIMELQEMFHEHNDIVKNFKTSLDQMRKDKCKLTIEGNFIPNNQHKGRYNQPTVEETAAVTIGNQFDPRDIVVR